MLSTPWRTGNGDGGREPQISSEILGRCLKINPKINHTQTRYVHEPMGGWIPLVMTKRHSGTIEKQRNQAKDGTPRNGEDREVADCPGSYCRLSTVWNKENKLSKQILDTTEARTADRPRKLVLVMARTAAPDYSSLGAGLSAGTDTVRGQTSSTQDRLPDCLGLNPRLSAGRVPAVPKIVKNTKSPDLRPNKKPTATKFEPRNHKAVGELPLRDHRSKFSQSTGKSRNCYEHEFFNPRT
jgi:hypothetical protein